MPDGVSTPTGIRRFGVDLLQPLDVVARRNTIAHGLAWSSLSFAPREWDECRAGVRHERDILDRRRGR
jgi:hypothetical protein